jgi:hypothetical protein
LALRENRIYFGREGDSLPVIKRYLSDVKNGVVPRTWWPSEEAGSNQSAKRDHLRKLLPNIEPFATPKPEELISLILSISSNPGDLVLDSFAGSGTTGAVAHKMGRRWIMVELGEHCHTHIIPRLKKVIDGEDPGGTPKRSGGKAAADSAITGWPPLCSKKTAGVILSSTKHTTRRCWPKRSANWRDSPTRPARRFTGSTATRPSAISFM